MQSIQSEPLGSCSLCIIQSDPCSLSSQVSQAVEDATPGIFTNRRGNHKVENRVENVELITLCLVQASYIDFSRSSTIPTLSLPSVCSLWPVAKGAHCTSQNATTTVLRPRAQTLQGEHMPQYAAACDRERESDHVLERPSEDFQ
jgi:hypothetical protein